MMNRSHGPRPGFTLIELLVVIVLIIALGAISIGVYAGLGDNYGAVRSAERVSGWLVIAKQSAHRNRQPYGVRFFADATGVIREAQYIEVPFPYVPQSADGVNPPRITINGTYPNQTIALVNVDMTGLGNNVLAGDSLSLPDFNKLLKIAAVDTKTGQFTPADPTQLPNLSGTTTYGTSNFGFHRAPRPVYGEPILEMPGTTLAIDGALCKTPSAQFSPLPADGKPHGIKPNEQFDVIFSPAGPLMNSTGIVALWVRDPKFPLALPPGPNSSRPDYEKVGNQFLVSVYSKTGAIRTVPVLLPPNDPYQATKDGYGTGL